MSDRAPADAPELAATLHWANSEGLTVAPRGAGTKSRARADVVLSLARMTAPVDHCAGDLTATVPAGASLAEVNTLLRSGGQWLTLDPPTSDRATIGGIIATNDSGPRRHRYGTPRDLIIGIEMALADGRIVKAGGRVVKNVAGYDLARVMCGSYGSLAVITSATFKVSPVAAASRTVVVDVADGRALGELARSISAAPVTPSAIELSSPPHRLMIRFDTTPTAAERQAALVCDLCAGHDAAPAVLSNESEADAWRAYEASIWQSPGTLLKIAVLPTQVSDLLNEVERSTNVHGVQYRAGGRAALGVIYVRLAETVDRHAAVLTDVRRHARAGGGHAIVMSADPAVEADMDRWGDLGDALPLMRAVKARFDPKGTLNPGCGPGGL